MKVQTEMMPGIELGHRAYWKREVLVYSSGILDHLPDGLRAPDCYGVEDSDTVARIWLEDLGQVNRDQMVDG
ncbi:MAG: hypothetical protein R2849_18980 [Thermomicrobiales bacterium]